MAYMDQNKKREIAAKVKPILAEYGLKATISTDLRSIYLNIKSGPIDFIGELRENQEEAKYLENATNLQLNPYHYKGKFSKRTEKLIEKLICALQGADWYDKSDIMTDYFNTAYYYHINVGKWDKPYILTAA